MLTCGEGDFPSRRLKQIAASFQVQRKWTLTQFWGEGGRQVEQQQHHLTMAELQGVQHVDGNRTQLFSDNVVGVCMFSRATASHFVFLARNSLDATLSTCVHTVNTSHHQRNDRARAAYLVKVGFHTHAPHLCPPPG